MMTWRDETGRGEDAATGCEAFESALPDYLDGSLDAERSDMARSHIASCDRCRSLVRDLESIRGRAAALPVLRPSRDLWAGIEARIQGARDERSGADASADVMPVQVGKRGRPGSARAHAMRRWFGERQRARSVALAAGLVIATAAVTFTATWQWTHQQPVTPRSTTGGSSQVAAAGPAGATPGAGVQRTPADRPSAPSRSGPTAGRVESVARAIPSPEFLYDRQIDALHTILVQRRSQLDPKTVAVVERNLRLIDTAIAESKAALAHDPANRFLADQLNHALDTKLELLQTAALLPSRT